MSLSPYLVFGQCALLVGAALLATVSAWQMALGGWLMAQGVIAGVYGVMVAEAEADAERSTVGDNNPFA